MDKIKESYGNLKETSKNLGDNIYNKSQKVISNIKPDEINLEKLLKM